MKGKPILITGLLLLRSILLQADDLHAAAPAERCIEACALIQQHTPSTHQQAWTALDAFSNTPPETLEIFSPAGASLYIKGDAPSLTSAVLEKNSEALHLYAALQKNPAAGSGHFYSWNEDGRSINRTDAAWLQCAERPDAPIVCITDTTRCRQETSNLLHGAWAGAFTDLRETHTPQPEKQAGQMNALFIPSGNTFFFRFTDNRQKLHGEGRILHQHLVGRLSRTEDQDFFYFDATIDPANATLRGTAFAVDDQSITTRRFFLKKEESP